MRVFFIILASITLVFEFYFWWLSGFLFVLETCIFWLVVSAIFLFFQRKKDQSFSQIFSRIILSYLGILGALIVVFVSWVGYNVFFPASLSHITLKNGTQEVVFLQMSHIGSEDFYRQTAQKIESLQKAGYIFLVEWVRPGTPENEKKFSQYLGINFTPTLYKSISSLISLSYQDYDTLFSQVPPESLVSVDVSIDDIVRRFESSFTGSVPTVPPPSLEGEIVKVLESISPSEKQFIAFVARWVLNFVLRSGDDLSLQVMDDRMKALFSIILDDRNASIVQYILSHREQKIAVVYWALHFNGVYLWLQQDSPEWRIYSLEPLFPYR